MVSTRQMTVTGGSNIEDASSFEVAAGNSTAGNSSNNSTPQQPQPPPPTANNDQSVGNGGMMAIDAVAMDAEAANNQQVAAALASVRQLSASAMVIIDATSRALNSGIPSPVVVTRPRFKKSLHLFDLPVEILDKICSYVGYKKVAQIRVVSRTMNVICSAALNSTFQRLQTRLQNRTKEIKCIMPRRESSRQIHPLRVECDIVDTCYMRLSLLQMTFGKHIDRKHICFFAGAVLDEVYNTLRQIKSAPTIRPHTMTEELYDLSTMAMEYFKEHLEPQLPTLVNFNRDFIDYHLSKSNLKTKYLLDTPVSSGGRKSNSANNSPACSSSANSPLSHSSSMCPSPPQSNMVLRKGIRKIKQGMKRYNNQLTVLRNDLRFCKRKSTEQAKHIGEMQKLLAETQKQVLEYAARLDENDKKNEEMSMKISTLLQESNKCKNELQYWRSINGPSGPGLVTEALSPHHIVDIDFQPMEGDDSWALAALMVADNGTSNGHSTTTKTTTDTPTTTATKCVVVGQGGVVDVPNSSVICSVGQPTKSVGSLKRKVSESVVQEDSTSSSSLNVCGSSSSLISESTMPSLTASSSSVVVTTTAQSNGSDINKKARRVQNKAKCLTYNNNSSSNTTTTSNISSLNSSSTIGSSKVTRNK